jgi:hypothetical protein
MGHPGPNSETALQCEAFHRQRLGQQLMFKIAGQRVMKVSANLNFS